MRYTKAVLAGVLLTLSFSAAAQDAASTSASSLDDGSTSATTTSSPTIDSSQQTAVTQSASSDSGGIAYGEGVIGPQKHATGLTALGPDLFGEQINTYTGGLTFSQTDLALPGNDSLPVNVTRRLVVDGNKSPNFGTDLGINLWRGHTFGEWELDLPYLTGMYSEQDGWIAAGSAPNARCSSATFAPPDVSMAGNVWFYSFQFWNGLQLNVPGHGEQGLLTRPTGAPLPVPAGNWTALTTKDQWHFACLSSLQSGQAGEGFLALAPDGTKYWFDWMVSYADRPLHGQGIDYQYNRPYRTYADMNRRVYRLYPTRVEDRFGNYVTYTYATAASQGLKLSQINASDGRSISFTYNTDGQIATATAGTQTISYSYTDGLLTTVTEPDSSRWTYSTSAAVNLARFVPIGDGNAFDDAFECQRMRTLTGDTADLMMTHPSGAQGVFRLGYNRLYRTNLLYSLADCEADNAPEGIPLTWRSYQPQSEPLRSDVLAVQTKTISGPGVAAQTWQFQHQDTFSLRNSAPTGDPVNGTRTMTMVRPDGSKEVSVFGTDALVNEGQLLSREVRAADGTVLTHQDNTYVQEAEMASVQFPDWMGQPTEYTYIRGREDYNRPLKQSVLQQQGVSFTTQIPSTCNGNNTLCFDAQVRPTQVSKFSSLGYSRTEATTYTDNTTAWVLGLVTQVKCVAPTTALPTGCGASGTVMSSTVYDPTYAVPTSTYSFGLLQKTSGYDFASAITTGQRGTLKTITDGNSHTTTLTNWKRGIPQSIVWADSTGVSAVVSDNGWITAATDELGSTTNYGYDTMGRLAQVTYPTSDTVAWASTVYGYSLVNSAEYGLPAGHWKSTVQTGTGLITTYFDAYWRPVLVRSEDTGSTATQRFTVTRYDAMNRQSFGAYPVGSVTSVNDALLGMRTYYDALGRPTRTEQDSEVRDAQNQMVPLVTTTQYLTGFQTKTTNPRLFSTTTSYKVFDTPSTDAPVSIVQDIKLSPLDQVTTTIARDIFGKPTAVTRSGTYNSTAVSATRSYVYDTYQRPCKMVNPEAGATLVDYDGANNIAWSADGTSLTTLVCNRANVLATDKTTNSYDTRNRPLVVDYPGGAADISYAYFADGALKTLTSGTSHWDYTYNKRRMPMTEQLTLGTRVKTIGHTYNTAGAESFLTYPSGLTVAFTPNGLGQATQAGGYATGVKYFPNGGMRCFNYGNKIVHRMWQNDRQLPDESLDILVSALDPLDCYNPAGTTKVLDDGYDYDFNGNVAAITDGTVGGGGTRTMTYDGLDRLLTTNAPNLAWMNATTSYDPLNNIRNNTVGARSWNYTYNATSNRLTQLANSSGVVQRAIAYDARGNITGNGSVTNVFDTANRLTSITGKESYLYDGYGRRVQITRLSDSKISYPIYDMTGQLIMEEDQRSGKTTDYVSLNGSLVAKRTAPIGTTTWTTFYEHTDALHSPVTETDVNANTTSIVRYTPYGETTSGVNVQGPGFTGHVTDAATGLSYMQQRYYDPVIGRFLSVDPMATDPNSGSSFNRYSYVNDNPYSFFDPDGRGECSPLTPKSCANDNADKNSSEDSAAKNEWRQDPNDRWSREDAQKKENPSDDKVADSGVDLHIVHDVAHALTNLAYKGAEIAADIYILIAPGGEEVKVANEIRTAKNGETAATAFGREMHANFNYGPGFQREFRLPSGKRVDAINFQTREILELKPNNARAIRLGERQLEVYRQEAMREFGGTWTTRVVTYGR